MCKRQGITIEHQVDDPAIHLQGNPTAIFHWSSNTAINHPSSKQPELLHYLCSTTPQRRLNLLLNLLQRLLHCCPTELTLCKALQPQGQGERMLAWVATVEVEQAGMGEVIVHRYESSGEQTGREYGEHSGLSDQKRARVVAHSC